MKKFIHLFIWPFETIGNSFFWILFSGLFIWIYLVLFTKCIRFQNQVCYIPITNSDKAILGILDLFLVFILYPWLLFAITASIKLFNKWLKK